MAEQLPKWTAQKVAILVIVIVFFVSSFALSATVLWEQFAPDDNNSTAQDITQEQPENSLQGKQLEGFEPVTEVKELQVIDREVGSGKEATKDSTVTAHYTGASALTGIIFESSLDTGEPFTSPLSGLIQGWQEGIPGMKEGGKRRLIIPAEQAYGEEPLVFDIELISVEG